MPAQLIRVVTVSGPVECGRAMIQHHVGLDVPDWHINITGHLPDQWKRPAAEVNAYLIDGGLILYIGLIVLFMWRGICYWRCCGRWLQYANYCSLLLALLLCLFGYDIYMFFTAALSNTGKTAWQELPAWLRPVILASPVISVFTYLMCGAQTVQHMERIRDDSAVKRHDRAVQIIMLPAVYAAMASTSLTRMYKTVISPQTSADDTEVQLLKSETCFWVGDLYEAWALYQFGKLTLELIESAIAKQGFSQREEERAAARALMVAHTAVESLAWVGILSFLVVCVLQAGFSLWILCFTPKENQVASFKLSMGQFAAAGYLASGAAIYNVYVVESTFHHFLEGYRPFLKFLTVKILVSFAFFQRGFFKFGIIIQDNLMPGVKDIPVIGELLNMPPDRFELFYACLLSVECFLVALMHWWAWNVSEEWYDEADMDRAKFGADYSREVLAGGPNLESGRK